MSVTLSLKNASNGEHWYKLSKGKGYDSDEIEVIANADPDGGKSVKLPTSIPSPFARMDLARAAFLNLGELPDLKGDKTYNDERVVSDCLDIGELFFNIDKFKDQLEIIAWDADADLKALVGSRNTGHQRLGEALDLFWKQDAPTYNFDQVRRLFILTYRGKPIGGTSPSTLFFSSGNDLSKTGLKIGSHQLFSTDFKPLHERDIEYQRFWYSLQANVPDFSGRFNAVDKYLKYCQAILRDKNPAQFAQYIGLSKDESQKLLSQTTFEQVFDELDTGQSGDVVEVLGYQLRKKKTDTGSIETGSDFIIRSAKYKRLFPDEPVPMALQNRLHKPFTYAPQIPWNPNTSVPYYVPQPYRPNKRKLPEMPDEYPFLTVSDFLEPYLVRLPYPTNNALFYSGGLKSANGKVGYLLPLKRAFFDFFNVEDLRNGTVRLNMEERLGGQAVQVTLDIPVHKRGQFITFERTYNLTVSDTPQTEPDPSQNEGIIWTKYITINIYPFIKSGSKPIFSPEYRLQFIEADLKSTDRFRFNAVEQAANTPLNIGPDGLHERQPRGSQTDGLSQYLLLKEEFDYLHIQVDTVGLSNVTLEGLLIPNWKSYNGGGEAFTFAVDFGTTNTHIEWKTDKKTKPQPFKIDPANTQVGTLAAPEAIPQFKDELFPFFSLLKWEFIPALIGPDVLDKFPTRTALSEKPNLDFSIPTITLADFNIPFFIEREPITQSDETRNLKWAKGNVENTIRVKAFLEELVLLIKNKVLFENGDLSKTTLRWFYPASMTPARIGQLRKVWKELFTQHITSETTNLQEVSESVAPFYHYKDSGKTSAANRPAINIDIGGGTTDVVIYENSEPTLLTSFRFAGNALYGDAFSINGAANSHGIVQKFKAAIEQKLRANNLNLLVENHESALNGNHSEEVISFWFSLIKDKAVKDKKVLNFGDMLADDEDLKIVFVLFYIAIIYHVASLMKARGTEAPIGVTFSGTGSKVLHIISDDTALLRKLTQLIFEKVYEMPYASNERMMLYTDSETPKEATCKGALIMSDTQIATSPEPVVYTGSVESLTYARLADRDVAKLVEQEVLTFYDFFLSLNSTFNFADNLLVSARGLSTAKEFLKLNLMEDLKMGIESKRNERQNDTDQADRPLEEPLFFYPIIGAINRLTAELV
jgi:hypothetical protein